MDQGGALADPDAGVPGPCHYEKDRVHLQIASVQAEIAAFMEIVVWRNPCLVAAIQMMAGRQAVDCEIYHMISNLSNGRNLNAG